MAKAKQLVELIRFIKRAQGFEEGDVNKFALSYLTSLIESLEAGNSRITDAVARRIETMNKLMSREARVAYARAQQE